MEVSPITPKPLEIAATPEQTIPVGTVEPTQASYMADPEGQERGRLGGWVDKVTAGARSTLDRVNVAITMPRGDDSLMGKGEKFLNRGRLVRLAGSIAVAGVGIAAAYAASKGHHTGLESMAYVDNGSSNITDHGHDTLQPAPDMHLAAHETTTATPEVTFSDGVRTITSGESLTHTLKELGVTDAHDQATYLEEHGAELERRGIAYEMGKSWGLNLGDDVDSHGNGRLAQDDLEFMHKKAVDDHYLPADHATHDHDAEGMDSSRHGQDTTDNSENQDVSPANPSTAEPAPGPSAATPHVSLEPQIPAGESVEQPAVRYSNTGFNILAAGAASSVIGVSAAAAAMAHDRAHEAELRGVITEAGAAMSGQNEEAVQTYLNLSKDKLTEMLRTESEKPDTERSEEHIRLMRAALRVRGINPDDLKASATSLRRVRSGRRKRWFRHDTKAPDLDDESRRRLLDELTRKESPVVDKK